MRKYPPVTALDAEERTRVVAEIFATSHTRYDFLNHLLSLRRDVGWRRFTVKKMRFRGTRRLLDLATGTADLAIAAALHYPEISVSGVDFSPGMLAVGGEKLARRSLSERVRLFQADALSLPFPDCTFDVAAVAFGMRNIPDKLRALGEMARVTVPGGQVMVLEMTFAPAPAIRGVYRAYLNRILPLLAAPFAANAAAYSYLPDSIMHFPPPEALRDLMREAGIERTRYDALSCGLAYLHVGVTAGGNSGGS
jgi:demethylmenaquinone methyltransferase/2-methoxy-6-polyprenyl-1,4-benzoquinol methylase